MKESYGKLKEKHQKETKNTKVTKRNRKIELGKTNLRKRYQVIEKFNQN